MIFETVPTGNINERILAIRTSMVNFFLYRSGADTIAIDTGMPNPKVAGDLRRFGLQAGEIQAVFLTHSDFDHVGGIGLFPNAKLYLSRDEEQLITGKVVRSPLTRTPKFPWAYTSLEDGAVVRVGAIEVRAIATPGHTLGSMSYLVDGSALFSGDTVGLKQGKAGLFLRFLNMNSVLQAESIRKLAEIDGVTILCTAHNGFTTDIATAFSRWR